ncbi:MAG: hypothetical protein JWP08_2987 [Bryobacterales bacterium]|nr:hypothetical protein [Bryobacterales bacterium]
MLPEQAPEIAVCDSHAWDARRYRVFGWRDLRRNLQIAFRNWRSNLRQNRTPESRLAQMVMEVGFGADGKWSADPLLLEQLKAQLTATDDLAVRKVFAAYLSES